MRGSLCAARQLRKRSGGAIVNVGSVLGDRSVLLQGSYCSIKSAVYGFTDTLRMKLERDDAGVSVTAMKPNGMDAPDSEHEQNKPDKPARLPLGKYDLELVAKTICFTCANPKLYLKVVGGIRAQLSGSTATWRN